MDMASSSAATEAVADHEEADRQCRKDDDEQDVQEFHGSVPSGITARIVRLTRYLRCIAAGAGRNVCVNFVGGRGREDRAWSPWAPATTRHVTWWPPAPASRGTARRCAGTRRTRSPRARIRAV